ncbi:MAG: hypothetical protein WED07_00595 [Candidatus Freyarchaeum deiterrae]
MTGMEGYTTYLENLEKKLRSKGFGIMWKIPIPPYQLDLIAVKASFELSKFGGSKVARFIFVTSMDKVNSEVLRDFSSVSTKFAFDNRKSIIPPLWFGGGLFSFPVVVSEDFEPEVKKWIENTLMEEHFTAAMEFPVIVSLKEKKIYYCKKTRLWGAAYYHGIRKFAKELLSF